MSTQLAFFPPPTKRQGLVSLEQALDEWAALLTKQRGYVVVRVGNYITGYTLERADG